MAQFLVFVVLGYLFGSISSAVIASKLFGLPDPRQEGSKNPGATNVLRLSGKKFAAAVMVADLLKGTIPVVIAKFFEADAIVVSFTALAAVVGHMYPVFFGFKGGKGVATAIGALLGLHFILGVIVAATWIIVAKISKYSSLASIISMFLAPIFALAIIGNIEIFPPLMMMTLLILFKHRDNITRLMDGKESKIKLKDNVIAQIMEEPPTVEQPPVPVEITEEVHVVTPVKAKPAAKKPAVVKKTTKTTTVKKATKATVAKKPKDVEKKPAGAKPKTKK